MGDIRFFEQLITRRSVYWFALAVASLTIFGFTKFAVEQFRFLQAQNISGLSVFNEVLMPLAGLTVLVQVFFSLLTVSFFVPVFRSTGQATLLSQSTISATNLIVIYSKVTFKLSHWPLTAFAVAALWLSFHSNLDSLRLLCLFFGMTSIMLILNLLFLSVSIRAKTPLFSFLIGLMLAGILIFIDSAFRTWLQFEFWRGLFSPLLLLREGAFHIADLASYFVWISASISLLSSSIEKSRNRNSFSIMLIIISTILALLLTSFIPGSFDLSRDERNSISQKIVEKLEVETNTLELVAVINDDSSREEIMRGFKLIQAQLPKAKLRFESRQSLGPELSHAGEFIQFKLGESLQSIAYPFEQDVKTVFQNGLHMLLSRKTQWITFLEGHEEASPFGKTTSDLRQFYQAIKAAGWPVSAQNLTQHKINQNTEVLVIASSKQPWLPGEMGQVLNYLKRGKHLLLLIDPESEVPTDLKRYLGLTKFPGTLVDWRGYQSGTPHPAVLVVDKFESHPTVDNLGQLLAFPWAAGLAFDEEILSSRFELQTILKTHQGVWNEYQITADSLAYDQEKGELQRSFPLAMGLQNKSSTQRIIVVGDSHFLSDSAINNYDNLQFSLNILSWLTGSEIEHSKEAGDSVIKPNSLGNFVLNWLMLIIIPLLFLSVAIRRSMIASIKRKN